MTHLCVCIADPDPAARALVAEVATDIGNCTIVSECANGYAALQSMRSAAPNLIVAAARLPRIDGLSLLRHRGLDSGPVFILTTHDDSDALRAFTYGAVDCVAKPLDRARCQLALRRAHRQLLYEGATGLGRQLASLIGEDRGHGAAEAQYLSQFDISNGAGSTGIPVGAVSWLSAEDCSTRLFVEGTSFLLRRALGHVERQLNPREFVRTHRSALVNARRVQGIQPRRGNELAVLLDSGVVVPISQRRRTAVLRFFGANPPISLGTRVTLDSLPPRLSQIAE